MAERVQVERRIKLLLPATREQQAKIGILTEHVIRLEAQMDTLLLQARAPTSRRLPGK